MRRKTFNDFMNNLGLKIKTRKDFLSNTTLKGKEISMMCSKCQETLALIKLNKHIVDLP